MKLPFVLLFTLAVGFAAEEKTRPKGSGRVDSTRFEYISDQAKFAREGSQKMTAESVGALRLAKTVVRAFLDREIQGEFSIAQAAWSYQVNFTRLKVNEGGVWQDAVEGFGQVYLSKTLTRVEIQYGP